jgi:streptogramin lyase
LVFGSLSIKIHVEYNLTLPVVTFVSGENMGNLIERTDDFCFIVNKNERADGGKRPLLLLGLCLLLAALLAHTQRQVIASPTTQPTGTKLLSTTEFPLPNPGSQPRNIIVEAPGQLWFTLPGINALGSLVVTSTVDYQFDIYPLPTPDSEPHDLVLDAANGVIWFTQLAGDRIGRFSLSTHQFQEFPLPTGSAPTGIALANDGTVWVALRDSNKIARLNPAQIILVNEVDHTTTPSTKRDVTAQSGTSYIYLPIITHRWQLIEEILYPTAGAQFIDIAVSTSNIVWVSAPGLNRMVTYNPDNGVFVNVNLHSFGQTPFPPHAVAMRGNTPWATAPTKNWIGVYIPGTLSLWSWYSAHPSDQGPTDLVHRSLGTVNELWYVQPADNRAGRLQINSQGQLILNQSTLLPTSNSFPEGIAVDNNGHAWITASAANAVVWWNPSNATILDLSTVQQP